MNALSLIAEGGHGWVQPFVVQLGAFVILAIVLAKFVVPMMGKMLGDRSKGIEDQFTKLERETRETQQKIAEIKEKLTRIEDETRRRIQSAVDEGTKTRNQALADANAQAAADLTKARRDIQFEREKAVLELRAEVARITIEITEDAVDKVVTEPVHGQMVNQALDNIEQAMRKK